MEWQQILGFYHVARTGSFTKAADRVFRTQSALSQQVKALENDLGCLLFERIGKRRLRLTLAGETLLRFAEDLLDREEALKEELGTLAGRAAGRLRIAAPFTTLYHLLPGPLKKFVQAFPDVRLTLLDTSQPKAIDLVRNGDVDIGVVQASAIPEDMSLFRWLPVRTVLVVPGGHPLSRMESVTVHHMADYPLIVPPNTPEYPMRARLERLFGAERKHLRIIMESSNVELSSLYVEMGFGLCFAMIVPDAVSIAHRNLAFIPLDHYFEPDRVSVIMRRTCAMTPIKEAFLSSLLGDFWLPREETPQ
jgi:DNA-binding transcriptional LysR family regulator